MSLRKELTELIKNGLVANFPGIQWVALIQGALRGTGIFGSITCDSIRFTYEAKGVRLANTTYTIFLLDPLCADTIDDVGDQVEEYLNNNVFSGFLRNSEVTNIQYGAPQGVPSAGMVKITYEATYNVEVS